MTRRTPLFLDTEFTGLRQNAQIISIALVCDDERWFYAEFNDYDPGLLTDWHREHVLPHLYFADVKTVPQAPSHSVIMSGDVQEIAAALKNWLGGFDAVEIWADVLPYDWVLFCELFGGALNLPPNVFYIPFDIATALRMQHSDPDMDRLLLAGMPPDLPRHNALDDARICRMCHARLEAAQLPNTV